jgi:hypothetical protein
MHFIQQIHGVLNKTVIKALAFNAFPMNWIVETRGKYHKAIYALCLKFALCAHLFSLFNQHVIAP